jgi:hypothetical protein
MVEVLTADKFASGRWRGTMFFIAVPFTAGGLILLALLTHPFLSLFVGVFVIWPIMAAHDGNQARKEMRAKIAERRRKIEALHAKARFDDYDEFALQCEYRAYHQLTGKSFRPQLHRLRRLKQFSYDYRP